MLYFFAKCFISFDFSSCFSNIFFNLASSHIISLPFVYCKSFLFHILIARSINTHSCQIIFFVDATHISVHACENNHISHILAIVLHTTLTIQNVRHHLDLTIFRHSLTSAVSPDCDINIYSVFGSGKNLSYRNSLLILASAEIPAISLNQ